MTDTGYYTADPTGQRGLGPYHYPNPQGDLSPYIASNEYLGLPPAGRSSYQPQPWEYSQGTPAFSGPSPDFVGGANQWGLTQALAQGQLMGAPATLLRQGQRDNFGTQIAATLASQTAQTGYLNTDYQLGLQRLGIEEGALGRQGPLQTALHDLALQTLGANADIARRQLEAGAIARGTAQWYGTGMQRTDIAQDLARRQQGENLNYTENMAKLDDAAKGLGISRAQLSNDLQKGLDRLGLSTALTVGDLTDKIFSSNIEDATMARQVWDQALQQSPYYARLYTGQNAAEGRYGPEGSGTERTYGGRR